MSDTGCYYDATGCLVCPEVAAQTGVPAHLEHRAVLGWNAGANSIDVRDGNLQVVFDMPLDVVGVVLGLKTGRDRLTVPSLIEHGFYFQKRAGLNLAQPIERGKVLGSPLTGRTAQTQFTIRRVDGRVTYLMDGTLVATSAMPSTGPKLVNSCLYASGDSAPTGVVSGGTDPGGGDPGGGSGVVAGSTDPANPTPLTADTTTVSIPDNSFAYFSIGVPPFGFTELDVLTGGGMPGANVALYVGQTAVTSTDTLPPGVQVSDSATANEEVLIDSPSSGLYIISIYSYAGAAGGITLTALLN